jgi:DNA-binding NtrC family response regulator
MVNKVLLVEDDSAYRQILAKILANHGYLVTEAADRHDALAQHDQDTHGFFCVLQDLGLPPDALSINEGLACMQALLAKQPSLKVIVLTCRDREEAGSRAIMQGAFDYLEKPIALDALLAAVERALLFSQTEHNLVSEGVVPVQFNAQLDQGLRQSCEVFEAAVVRRVLEECDFNIRLAAEHLGVKRENLYYLIKKHDINTLRAVPVVNSAQEPA